MSTVQIIKPAYKTVSRRVSGWFKNDTQATLPDGWEFVVPNNMTHQSCPSNEPESSGAVPAHESTAPDSVATWVVAGPGSQQVDDDIPSVVNFTVSPFLAFEDVNSEGVIPSVEHAVQTNANDLYLTFQVQQSDSADVEADVLDDFSNLSAAVSDVTAEESFETKVERSPTVHVNVDEAQFFCAKIEEDQSELAKRLQEVDGHVVTTCCNLRHRRRPTLSLLLKTKLKKPIKSVLDKTRHLNTNSQIPPLPTAPHLQDSTCRRQESSKSVHNSPTGIQEIAKRDTLLVNLKPTVVNNADSALVSRVEELQLELEDERKRIECLEDENFELRLHLVKAMEELENMKSIRLKMGRRR